jgi:plastocyanin
VIGFNRLVAALAVAATALVALAACGGGGSPTGPSGGGAGVGTGSPGASGATITIANGRVTPSTVTIAVGQSVTFINNDGRVHNVSSDPHPNHTECPSINGVGTISNGQTKLTNSLPTARSCGFHDHDDPDNNQLKGTIVIQ